MNVRTLLFLAIGLRKLFLNRSSAKAVTSVELPESVLLSKTSEKSEKLTSKTNSSKPSTLPSETIAQMAANVSFVPKQFITLRSKTILNICPQSQNIVIERLGKFLRVQGPGLFWAFPFIDKLYAVEIREIAFPIIPSKSITQDNVPLEMAGVVYFKFTEPYKCVYGISQAEFAITQFAQSAMRVAIGKHDLDDIFHNRDQLNVFICDILKEIVQVWGITVLRYEITDIFMADDIKDAMSRQVSAERTRRSDVLHAEALKKSEILKSEGFREKLINESLGTRIKTENEANAYSDAIKIKAQATKEKLIKEAEGKAKALNMIAEVLKKEQTKNAANLEISKEYVRKFGDIAAKSNSVIIPKNSKNIAGFITKILQVGKFNMEKQGKNLKEEPKRSLNTPPPAKTKEVLILNNKRP